MTHLYSTNIAESSIFVYITFSTFYSSLLRQIVLSFPLCKMKLKKPTVTPSVYVKLSNTKTILSYYISYLLSFPALIL